MLYMVIERFKDAPEIYRPFEERGRMMPAGLNYLSSWISENKTVCYQLMKTSDAKLFPEWTRHWDDLMEFEIVPVVGSAEMAERMKN